MHGVMRSYLIIGGVSQYITTAIEIFQGATSQNGNFCFMAEVCICNKLWVLFRIDSVGVVLSVHYHLTMMD